MEPLQAVKILKFIGEKVEKYKLVELEGGRTRIPKTNMTLDAEGRYRDGWYTENDVKVNKSPGKGFNRYNSETQKFESYLDGKFTNYNRGIKQETVEYKDGKLNGWSITFWNNGDEIHTRTHYKDDLKDGKAYSYFYGKIKSVSNYTNGKPNGKFISRHKDNMTDGAYKTTTLYDNGVLISSKDVYDNGQLRCNYQIINGERTGVDIVYYDDGNIFRKTEMRSYDGFKTTYQYDREGKLMSQTGRDAKGKETYHRWFSNGKTYNTTRDKYGDSHTDVY